MANPQAEWSGIEWFLKLRRYPALLLLYSGAVAAVAAESYETLIALLTNASIHDSRYDKDRPPYDALSPHRVIEKEFANTIFKNRLYVRMSDHLSAALRLPFEVILPDQREYQRCFDRFEYLRALLESDLTGEPNCIGSFGWRWKYTEQDVMRQIEAEERDAGKSWPPYQAGWFQGQRADSHQRSSRSPKSCHAKVGPELRRCHSLRYDPRPAMRLLLIAPLSGRAFRRCYRTARTVHFMVIASDSVKQR